jgi:hypothetical protein
MPGAGDQLEILLRRIPPNLSDQEIRTDANALARDFHLYKGCHFNLATHRRGGCAGNWQQWRSRRLRDVDRGGRAAPQSGHPAADAWRFD